MPQVLECLHVTGADSCLFTVVARNMSDLEQILAGLNKYGETRTSIVMGVASRIFFTRRSVSEAAGNVKILVPVYFPTAGAGSGAEHQKPAFCAWNMTGV